MDSFQNPATLHRDLSWLQFNGRVLNEARDLSNPILERLKFLTISSTNLDEFFQIRFASLNRTIAALRRHAKSDRASELYGVRQAILREVRALGKQQTKLLTSLSAELEKERILIFNRQSHSPEALRLARKIFDESVFPVLAQPEAYVPLKLRTLGNLATAAIFRSGVWCPIPRSLPPAIARIDDHATLHIFFLGDLLSHFLGEALNLKENSTLIRLTRDGDLALDLGEEEDSESVPDMIRKELISRDRGKPVRLQYEGNASPEVLQAAEEVLSLSPDQLFPAPLTLFLHGTWGMLNQLPESMRENPTLFFPPIRPVIPKILAKQAPIFEVLDERDVLLHHPYDSFDAFVNFIRKACEDPSVISVQMTVYRTDAVSPIIDALKKGAKSRKVRVFIELRARFDELNNLRLAEDLRKAGVEVVFGFGKLKLHAKIAWVERKEGAGSRYYTHLSTGNYNAVTARQYTDLAVLTSNSDVGQDAKYFFDAVAKGEVPATFRKLVSAPGKLHRRIHHYIEVETKAAQEGRPARIFAKVNALVDEAVISSLYKASRAGVKIDLVVRGACSLVPGISGISENIRVISIVDRFLEHSRIYYFESSGALYLSSADWMPRNFYSRLEIAYPILDPRLFRYVRETMIPTYFTDTAKARELSSDGSWRRRTAGPRESVRRSQEIFQDLAKTEYKGTALE